MIFIRVANDKNNLLAAELQHVTVSKRRQSKKESSEKLFSCFIPTNPVVNEKRERTKIAAIEDNQ